MKFAVKFSLKHMTMVKIAAELWNKEDIKPAIAEFVHPYHHPAQEFRDQWEELETKTLDRVSALPLPDKFKKAIEILIKPIGLEIRKWWDYHHDESVYLVIRLPDKFFWTPQGTVDYKKTAAALVRSGNLEWERRFKLACINCLEKDVRSLWAREPDDCKFMISADIVIFNEERIMNFEENNVIPAGSDIPDLIDFWTCFMLDDQIVLKNLLRRRGLQDGSPQQFAFDCAIRNGNRSASEYFLAKLSRDEREDVLIIYFMRVLRLPNCNAAVVCFLLNEMTAAQQELVLRQRIGEVLFLLLCWSWQSLFTETAMRWWHLISNEYYLRVLVLITAEIRRGCDHYDYDSLFRDFWLRGSDAYKQFVLQSRDAIWIGIGLRNAEPKRTGLARLMFEEATTVQIKEVICTVETINTLSPCVYQEIENFLTFFTEEKFVTEEEMKNCK